MAFHCRPYAGDSVHEIASALDGISGINISGCNSSRTGGGPAGSNYAAGRTVRSATAMTAPFSDGCMQGTALYFVLNPTRRLCMHCHAGVCGHSTTTCDIPNSCHASAAALACIGVTQPINLNTWGNESKCPSSAVWCSVVRSGGRLAMDRDRVTGAQQLCLLKEHQVCKYARICA